MNYYKINSSYGGTWGACTRVLGPRPHRIVHEGFNHNVKIILIVFYCLEREKVSQNPFKS